MPPLAIAGLAVAAFAIWKLSKQQTQLPPPPGNTAGQNAASTLGGAFSGFLSSFSNPGSQPATAQGASQIGAGIGTFLGGLVNGHGDSSGSYVTTTSTPPAPSTDVNTWDSYQPSNTDPAKLTEQDDPNAATDDVSWYA